MTLYRLFQAGSVFLNIVSTAILIYVILSWFRPRNPAYLWLEGFVSPFVRPFRRLSVWIMSRTGLPLDFSCWFAIVGINIVNQLWWALYRILRGFR